MHKLRDVDERSCLICKECLHRDIAIEGLTGYLPGLRQDVCWLVNAVNVFWLNV